MKTPHENTLIKKLLDYAQKFVSHPRYLGQIYFTSDAQTIKFKSKDTEGTTTEEVLQILIHRLRTMQAVKETAENVVAIEFLVYAHRVLESKSDRDAIDASYESGIARSNTFFTRKAGE